MQIELAGAKVQLEGTHVGDRAGLEPLFLFRRQSQGERASDAARDLLLNLEHILERAVEALAPQRRIRLGLDELRRHSER